MMEMTSRSDQRGESRAKVFQACRRAVSTPTQKKALNEQG
jgi:hypothetical protein